jgi:GT2 family glycosyltransferase
MLSVIQQSVLPKEIIVVDNSDGQDTSTKEFCADFNTEFHKVGVTFKYLPSKENSLTSSRNLGVAHSSGEIIFFHEDDARLDHRCLEEILKCYKEHPEALGVQGQIIHKRERSHWLNAIYPVFFLPYSKKNTWRLLPSGENLGPYPITKTIKCMRFSGISSYRRRIFKKLRFDQKMKKWAAREDADFSYRLYKLHPHTLFLTPKAKIFHKISSTSRLSTKIEIYMSIIYRFYFFFKNLELSVSNLLALVWSMTGRIICRIAGLIARREPRREWWTLIYLINSYMFSFRYIKNIIQRDLGFFDKMLNDEI